MKLERCFVISFGNDVAGSKNAAANRSACISARSTISFLTESSSAIELCIIRCPNSCKMLNLVRTALLGIEWYKIYGVPSFQQEKASIPLKVQKLFVANCVTITPYFPTSY